jgi:anti-sigma B factor antagonist
LRHSLRPRGPVRFDLRVSQRPDSVWLRISGELDVLTTPKLAAELNTIVRRSMHHVVVDLREAEFIDSAGLQILLGTQRRLSRASRRLTVICDEGPVRRVIELTRLGEILGLVTGAEAEDR